MDSFKTKANHYLTTIDKELAKQPYLNRFEHKTGCPKSVAVFSAALAGFFLIFFNYGAQLITSILAWIYPGNTYISL